MPWRPLARCEAVAETVSVHARGDLHRRRKDETLATALVALGLVEGPPGFGLRIAAGGNDQRCAFQDPFQQLPANREAPRHRHLSPVEDHGVRKPERRPYQAERKCRVDHDGFSPPALRYLLDPVNEVRLGQQDRLFGSYDLELLLSVPPRRARV